MAQNEYNLGKVLEQCRQSAAKGCELAVQQAGFFLDTLASARDKVQSAIEEFRNSPVWEPDAADTLARQLGGINSLLSTMSDVSGTELPGPRKNHSGFSITLFGRTMAGKSTLMEILTHGDGKSIGKGTQRTTRDVRRYEWNGLEITDVPGVCAFGGQRDEALAFEAAKSADLILFLITDDAPQAAEAECFSRVLSLGKPVICIMNVKVAVSEQDDLELALWDIEDRFDRSRLDAIREEFLAYAGKTGQEWDNIPFVYVHLQSAFLAERTADRKSALALFDASNMKELKRQVIKEISEKGGFFRIRTFTDAAAVPALRSEEELLRLYDAECRLEKSLSDRKKELGEWKDKFLRDGCSRIDSAIADIRGRLSSEAAAFADEHLSDGKADEAWKEVCRSCGVTEICSGVIGSLVAEADDCFSASVREQSGRPECVFELPDDESLRMPGITDFRRIWNWLVTVIGGGLSIIASYAWLADFPHAGAIGWLAFIYTVFGVACTFFIRSREEREYRARTVLGERLEKNIESLCDRQGRQMIAALNELASGRTGKLIGEMERLGGVLSGLGEDLRSLAWKIDGRLLDLNRQMVGEALRQIGAGGQESGISGVARIPGDRVILLMKEEKSLPGESLEKLCSLMSEHVECVCCTSGDGGMQIICKIVGQSINPAKVYVDEKAGTARVPLEGSGPAIVNRARLAEQLTRLVITR